MAEVERRSALLRVPCVRRCELRFDDGGAASAFLVNINTTGAYVARDEMPKLGQSVTCRFSLPGNDRRIEATGVVIWLNPGQQHPVHSLPPGFGMKFRDVGAEDRERLEAMIHDYLARHPGVVR